MKASILKAVILMSAACFAPSGYAQLINKSTQEILDKAKEAKWERLTVKNESGTVAYVVVERTPQKKETHTCPADAPRRARCTPGQPVTSSEDAGPTTTEKKTLTLGQSYTNNFNMDTTKVVVSVYTDLLDGGGYCMEKQQLDGSVKGMSFKLTGVASKGSFKCNKTVE